MNAGMLLMLTNVLEKVRWLLLYSQTLYVIAASLYSTRSMTGNQCRALSNGCGGLRYGVLHTSLAREFCTLCRLLKFVGVIPFN